MKQLILRTTIILSLSFPYQGCSNPSFAEENTSKEGVTALVALAMLLTGTLYAYRLLSCEKDDNNIFACYKTLDTKQLLEKAKIHGLVLKGTTECTEGFYPVAESANEQCPKTETETKARGECIENFVEHSEEAKLYLEKCIEKNDD